MIVIGATLTNYKVRTAYDDPGESSNRYAAGSRKTDSILLGSISSNLASAKAFNTSLKRAHHRNIFPLSFDPHRTSRRTSAITLLATLRCLPLGACLIPGQPCLGWSRFGCALKDGRNLFGCASMGLSSDHACEHAIWSIFMKGKRIVLGSSCRITECASRQLR